MVHKKCMRIKYCPSYLKLLMTTYLFLVKNVTNRTLGKYF